MSDYKIPQASQFVENLPRNSTEKVVKTKLSALFGVGAKSTNT
jgi:acyl-coenzyme A synthetase/AMP-(fatty) acid ligase